MWKNVPHKEVDFLLGAEERKGFPDPGAYILVGLRKSAPGLERRAGAA